MRRHSTPKPSRRTIGGQIAFTEYMAYYQQPRRSGNATEANCLEHSQQIQLNGSQYESDTISEDNAPMEFVPQVRNTQHQSHYDINSGCEETLASFMEGVKLSGYGTVKLTIEAYADGTQKLRPISYAQQAGPSTGNLSGSTSPVSKTGRKQVHWGPTSILFTPNDRRRHSVEIITNSGQPKSILRTPSSRRIANTRRGPCCIIA